MTPARRTLAALLLLAAAVSAAADEHVLFEVQGNDTVLGTIRPGTEQESIFGNLVAGTSVRAAVKSTQKTGPIPTLQLVFADVPVVGTDVVTKGRGTTLRPFVVPAGGAYKVVVAGDGLTDGDYQLAVNWTPRKSFSGTGTSAGDTTFPFSAPANSVVSIALSAAAGSAFVPDLVEIDGPGNIVVPLTGGGKAKGVRLAVRGDWTLHFKSDAAEGAYKVVVKIAPPKVKKHKVDIRDRALAGAFSGGPVVVGAVIDPGTGGSVSVGGAGSPIDGSSVDIPPGALGSATGVFIAQATVYPLDDGVHPAGPAVEFGPSGTTFPEGKEATVTIPFDPNAFPGGTASLVVYVKDQNGVVTAVPQPYTFGAGTVSFVTSHFSTFLSATTATRGLPTGSYLWVEVTGAATIRLGGTVGCGIAFAELNAEGAGELSAEYRRENVSFDPGQGAPFPPVTGEFNAPVTVDDAMVADDDAHLRLIDVASGLPAGNLRRGARDDVLVLDHGPDSQLGAVTLLRRTPDVPTLNTIAGTWHALVWEFKADAAAAGGTTAPLFAIADSGTATISPAGAVTMRFAGGVKRFTDYPGGEWNREVLKAGQTTGTVDTNVETFGINFDTGSHVALNAVLDGDVLIGQMVGVDRGFGGSAFEIGLLVLVRQSKGVTSDDVAGTYFDDASGVALHAPDANPVTEHLGITWFEEVAVDRLFADRTVIHDGIGLASVYAADEQQAVFSFDNLPGNTVPWKVTSAGDFTVALPGIVGAALPDKDLLVYVRHDAAAIGLAFAVRSRKTVAAPKR